MKIREWLDAGFEPPFATIEEWIADHLGRLEAEERATYALESRLDGRDGVRILSASDIGLFDFFWYRPERVEQRSVTGRLVPWESVRGLTLVGETRLNETTLMHGAPLWRLSLSEPEVVIEQPPSEAVLLDFWKACREALEKHGTG